MVLWSGLLSEGRSLSWRMDVCKILGSPQVPSKLSSMELLVGRRNGYSFSGPFYLNNQSNKLLKVTVGY